MTHPRPYARRLARSAAPLLVVPIAGLALLSGASAQNSNRGDQVDATREILARYVETRRLISKARSDWRLGRQIIVDRINFVTEEIDAVRDSAEKLESESSKIQRDIAERDSKLAELSTAADGLAERIDGYEARIRTLVPQLPELLRGQLETALELLPDVDGDEAAASDADAEAPAKVERSLSERFATVALILSEIDKFNAEIHLESELRALDAGSDDQQNVSVIYIGLGQAYYVNEDLTRAGRGRIGDDGNWAWFAEDDIAPQVNEAVRILKNEAAATFVPLPVDID